MSDIRDALAAGARIQDVQSSFPVDPKLARDPYPSDRRISLFRSRVLTFLAEIDAGMSVSELVEMLENEP